MRRRVGSHKKARGPAALDVGGADVVRGMGAEMGRFLEWLRVKQYSERTLATRASGLRRFRQWCEERGLQRAEEVTRPVVEQYQRWLYHHRRADGRGLSTRAQIGRLEAVRGFFAWLARTNRLAYNPASEIELPKLPARLPRDVLTEAEAERVLGVPDVGTALGLRDRAMLEVLYATGMRRGELVGLDLADVDGERGMALIREGKGRKDRMVPVGERALLWIERYAREARPRLTPESASGPLFVTETGERMSGAWVTDLVGGYVERSGVGRRGSCHLFRHTCATLMLEGGADIRFIQQLLGHANLATTEIYTRVSIVQLRAIHAATHPGAKVRGAEETQGHELEGIRAKRRAREGETQ